MSKYLVSQMKPDANQVGIEVDGKYHKFSKSGRSFYVSDPGKAKEIKDTVGQNGTKDVVITKVPDTWNDGHRTGFSLLSLGNWKDRIDWST